MEKDSGFVAIAIIKTQKLWLNAKAVKRDVKDVTGLSMNVIKAIMGPAILKAFSIQSEPSSELEESDKILLK